MKHLKGFNIKLSSVVITLNIKELLLRKQNFQTLTRDGRVGMQVRTGSVFICLFTSRIDCANKRGSGLKKWNSR